MIRIQDIWTCENAIIYGVGGVRRVAHLKITFLGDHLKAFFFLIERSFDNLENEKYDVLFIVDLDLNWKFLTRKKVQICGVGHVGRVGHLRNT